MLWYHAESDVSTGTIAEEVGDTNLLAFVIDVLQKKELVDIKPVKWRMAQANTVLHGMNGHAYSSGRRRLKSKLWHP